MIFLCILLLVFCPPAGAAGAGGAGPPESPPALLSYRSAEESQTPFPAVLYFRYGDTGLLGQEERTLTISRTGSFAQALVQALVEGPDPLSPHFSPPFPPGTEVLSVQEEGQLLFVTFNEAVAGRYPDESALLLTLDEYRRAEGSLRRKLAMSGLVNTLTENTSCGAVQVLVRAETYITTSMRLSGRYYLEDSDLLPDPLVRDEPAIMTPAAASALVLDAWAGRGMEAAAALLDPPAAPPDAPFVEAASAAPQQAPALAAYVLSPGTVSPDGQSAIVCVDYQTVGASGETVETRTYPLKLRRSEGVWFVSRDSFLLMAGFGP